MTVSNRVVNVINLGRLGFLQAYDVQLRYAHQHLDYLAGRRHAEGCDTLLLVEHNPVFTVGIRKHNLDEAEESRLKKLGAEFFRTNRGGLITFHGPGQLVAYPILNLRHFKPSIKWYIATLQSTIINTCRRLGIEAHTTEHTGVWVEDRKIAAIGVHGSRYITTHGMSLNCDTDLAWFKHIVPCGIEGKGVTSLSQERQKPTPIKKVITPFLSAFEEEFGCKMEFSMFDSEDVSLLRPEEECSAGGMGGASGSHSPLTAAQLRMRLMSTSAAAQELQVPQGPRPRVSMW